MIKVSIIVPVYNKEQYLEKCLDCLVKQTLKEIEIIIIDDASQDEGTKIIKKYQKEYPDKIVFLQNKKNKGIGKTRNIGIKHAQGEYLGFVDSDDYISYDMYESYYQFAKKNQLSMVTSHYYKVWSDHTSIFRSPYFEITSLKQDPTLLNKVELGPCNKLILKKVVDDNHIQFEEKLKYEDMPFIIKCLYYGTKIGHLDAPYYYYQIHGSSETTTMDQKVYDMFQILDQVNTLLGEDPTYEKALEMLNITQITRYMLQQKYQKDPKIAQQFIENGYQYLNQKFPNWKQNSYYKKTSFLKRLIKNNKCFMKRYSTIFKLREDK